MSFKIEIYTDGACSGNPGKGGYGIVMRVPEKNYQKTFSKGFRKTTIDPGAAFDLPSKQNLSGSSMNDLDDDDDFQF
jgi:ribonuclease HI